jgi:hypothetical protein
MNNFTQHEEKLLERIVDDLRKTLGKHLVDNHKDTDTKFLMGTVAGFAFSVVSTLCENMIDPASNWLFIEDCKEIFMSCLEEVRNNLRDKKY